MSWILLTFLVVGTTLNVMVQVFGKHILVYHFAESALEVHLFRARVLTVPYDTIAHVRPLTFSDTLFHLRNLRLTNKVIGPGVLLDTTTGRRILITPSTPSVWVVQLESRIRRYRKLANIGTTPANT